MKRFLTTTHMDGYGHSAQTQSSVPEYMYINVAFYVRSERSLYYTKFNELLRSRAKDIIMQCICRAVLNVLATCKKVLRGMTMLP